VRSGRPYLPHALYRLVCALGYQSLVTVLASVGWPLPTCFLADEKHSHCLTEQVYLPPTIVCGRVVWHLGLYEHACAAAFTQSYQNFNVRHPSRSVVSVKAS